jgi:hypothetical protein
MLSCVFRCAQKIVTQLESVPLLGKSRNKYEKLSQDDDGEEVKKDRKWWPDRTKDEEKIDNKKNELTEKHMELKEKQKLEVKKSTIKDARL